MMSTRGVFVVLSLVLSMSLSVLFTKTTEASTITGDRADLGPPVLFEGDIIIDDRLFDVTNKEHNDDESETGSGQRRKRAVVKWKNSLWEGGIMKYTFSTEDPVSATAKQLMKRAMAHIEERTCIKFQEKDEDDKNYVEIMTNPEWDLCASNVGKFHGKHKQLIILSKRCTNFNTMVHELGHALGMWHEQDRPDRDKFVKINWENIRVGAVDFSLNHHASTRGYPYDYRSVMHYSARAGAVDEHKITIEVKNKAFKLGAPLDTGLSTIDVAKLRDLYRCNFKQFFKQFSCEDGWKKRFSGCYRFFSKQRKGAEGAHRHCRNLRSHLVIVDSKRKQEFLNEYLSKNFKHISKWRTAGKKINKQFVWYKGEHKKQNLVYTNWSSDDPNYYRHKTIVLLRKQNYTWGTNRLSTELPFICEKAANRECFHGTFADGRDYRGKVGFTKDFITCQKWTEEYPRENAFLRTAERAVELKGKKDKYGLGDHNYCRNPPDSSGGRKKKPWCYTTKKWRKWQYCDISICTDKPDKKI